MVAGNSELRYDNDGINRVRPYMPRSVPCYAREDERINDDDSDVGGVIGRIGIGVIGQC